MNFSKYDKSTHSLTINLQGVVGWDFTSSDIQAILEPFGDDPDLQINVFINSPGGYVWEGNKIYDTLASCAGKVTTISYIAQSIASIIALAGSERLVVSPSNYLVHSVSVYAGRLNAASLAQLAREINQYNRQLAETYTAHVTDEHGVYNLDYFSEKVNSGQDHVLNQDDLIKSGLMNGTLTLKEALNRYPAVRQLKRSASYYDFANFRMEAKYLQFQNEKDYLANKDNFVNFNLRDEEAWKNVVATYEQQQEPVALAEATEQQQTATNVETPEVAVPKVEQQELINLADAEQEPQENKETMNGNKTQKAKPATDVVESTVEELPITGASVDPAQFSALVENLSGIVAQPKLTAFNIINFDDSGKLATNDLVEKNYISNITQADSKKARTYTFFEILNSAPTGSLTEQAYKELEVVKKDPEIKFYLEQKKYQGTNERKFQNVNSDTLKLIQDTEVQTELFKRLDVKLQDLTTICDRGYSNTQDTQYQFFTVVTRARFEEMLGDQITRPRIAISGSQSKLSLRKFGIESYFSAGFLDGCKLDPIALSMLTLKEEYYLFRNHLVVQAIVSKAKKMKQVKTSAEFNRNDIIKMLSEFGRMQNEQGKYVEVEPAVVLYHPDMEPIIADLRLSNDITAHNDVTPNGFAGFNNLQFINARAFGGLMTGEERARVYVLPARAIKFLEHVNFSGRPEIETTSSIDGLLIKANGYGAAEIFQPQYCVVSDVLHHTKLPPETPVASTVDETKILIDKTEVAI